MAARRGLTSPMSQVGFRLVTALHALSPAARGSLLVLVAAGASGTLGPILSLLYAGGFTPLGFAVWRGIVAGGTLWLFVLWQRRRDPAANPVVLPQLSGHERLMLLGFVGSNIILNTSLFVAINTIPIAVALLTFYTYPVLLALYGRLTGTETIGPAKVVALVLGLAGLGLVVTASGGGSSRGLDPLGLGLAMLAAVTGAAWVVFSKALVRVPPEQAMATSLVATIVVIGALLLATGQASAITFPVFHPDTLVAVTILSLMSGAAAATIFTRGVRLISRVRAGILGLIEPIVGTVAAAVVLGQVLAPIQVVGGVLVLAAAVLIQRAQDAPAVAAMPARADPSEAPARAIAG
jgi:drug/metabolite transporter (DMT)-like permease